MYCTLRPQNDDDPFNLNTHAEKITMLEKKQVAQDTWSEERKWGSCGKTSLSQGNPSLYDAIALLPPSCTTAVERPNFYPANIFLFLTPQNFYQYRRIIRDFEQFPKPGPCLRACIFGWFGVQACRAKLIGTPRLDVTVTPCFGWRNWWLMTGERTGSWIVRKGMPSDTCFVTNEVVRGLCKRFIVVEVVWFLLFCRLVLGLLGGERNLFWNTLFRWCSW